MNYFFKKDSFFSAVFVFVVIGCLYFNTLNSHIFNPFHVSLSDFSFNDLAFSQAHLSNTKDERIVIIDIDTIGRKTIGTVLKNLSSYNPKVIGLDVLLPPKDDSANDELASIIGANRQIVLAQKVHLAEEESELSGKDNQFIDQNHLAGFVNFRAEENSVVRYWPPYLKNGENSYNSFAASILKLADSLAYQKLLQRNHVNEWINYKRRDSDYYVFSYSDIINDRVDSSFLRDKIVLVGLVSHKNDDVEDKHFTPLNNKLFGRSLPDMNGAIIHANIISMVLDKDYILRVPFWVMFLIGFLITWVYMAFLLKFYIHKHLWFHISAKVVELLLGICLVYLSILLLRYFSISIDFTIVLIAIIIAVDILYFYEGLRNWLEKKFSIKSIFNKHHS